MGWQDYANKHINTPTILVSIAFNSGTRYYSNTYVRTSTQLYKGNILNLPEIKNSIGDIKRTYERNKITLIFNDSDYEFRGLEDTEVISFKNRILTIKLAFEEDNFVSPITLFTGYLYDWTRKENLTYEIEVEERSLNMDNEYPNKRVELADYPYADGTAVGWIIPIPYGTISALGDSGDGAFGHPSLSQEASSTGLLFVDTRTSPDLEKHLVGLQETGQAITVNRVYKNGNIQILNTHYTIANATVDGREHTTINWIAGVNPTASDFISCDIAFGTRRPVEAIRHFLENFCNYVAGNFNAANYTAARNVEDARTYGFDGVLWKKGTLRSILDVWRDEYELDIYWNKDGETCFKYLSSIISGTINHYKDLRDILKGFESNPQVYELLNKLKYGYNYHYSKTYFYNYATREDTDSQTKYGATFEAFKGFQWIRSSSVANDIASRKIIRFKDPVTFDSLRLPLKTFSDDLTDLVRITHFEGLGSSGYLEKIFQIKEMSFDINKFVNSVLLEDTSNFMGNACILGDDTVLPASWNLASGSERDYCYMCDESTEQFSDGEPGKKLLD